MDELKWVGSGPDRALMLGFVPRISIDPRIRCPREFSEEFPCPSSPTVELVALALNAEEVILSAVWPYRQHIEVIKVWFSLDKKTSSALFLYAEAVVVGPNGEKFPTTQSVDLDYWYGVGAPIFAPPEDSPAKLASLALKIARGVKGVADAVIALRTKELDHFSATFR